MSTEGTVDGGIFRFKAAHFEWLLAVGEVLGLGFHNLGKRKARVSLDAPFLRRADPPLRE